MDGRRAFHQYSLVMKVPSILKGAGGFARARFLGQPRPLAVGWDVTRRCNLRCRYCGSHRLDPAELDTAAALDLVDQMASSGVVRVHLSGGEPMMRTDLGAIVRRLTGHGIQVAINTNGHQVARRVHELGGVRLIRLSYDGPEELHDRLRGAGAHQVMRRALDAAQQKGLRVLLNATINATNVDRLDQLIAESRRLEIPIKFQPISEILAYGEDINGTMLSPEAWREAVVQIRRERRRNRLIVNSRANLDYYLAHPRPELLPCTAGILYARMDPMGRLYPCSMKMAAEYMRESRVQGFSRAFRALPAVHCSDCFCPPTLELNALYALDWRSILGLRRYL